ncbi:hypothetical protein EVA_16637 [gut metagenome]|uniref:Uncharacterized protein n=1 Tax=gut metagenome TaxID=749906 RepID=J9G0D2_9ZZZZ
MRVLLLLLSRHLVPSNEGRGLVATLLLDESNDFFCTHTSSVGGQI